MEKNNNNTVSNVLEIFVEHDGIRLEDTYGKAIAVLGVRGSGKTNTAAVFVEELLSKGVPVIVLDIDGEYWTLRESYDVLIVSADENADILLNISDSGQASRLAKALLDTYVPAVIDLSEFIIDEYSEYLVAFLEEVWRSSKLYRRPLFLVIEEAHEFIPQGYSGPVKDVLVRIALRGRKRGLGLLMVSQRSAKVDKDVLSQAEYYVLHKVMHPADLRVYKELLPLNPKDIESVVPKLGVGEALFYDGLGVRKVKVRKRRTFHIGYTPKTYFKMSFRLRSLDQSLLERILSIIDQQTNATRSVHGEPSPQDNVEDSVPTTVEDRANRFEHEKEAAFIPSQRALEIIVWLVSILARAAPSIIAHVYVLAKEQRWLSYSELRELSSFRAVNTREFRRLERLGILELERHGREMFVRQ
ncbi:MAG: ATP-binding protein, partial [Desulfurococcales archaeon]|nr:ATP-binding protein [Desulfurococcales archaeon]